MTSFEDIPLSIRITWLKDSLHAKIITRKEYENSLAEMEKRDH